MSTQPKLLVVDREDAIGEGCRRLFGQQGFEVRKCNAAALALKLAAGEDFAAILYDVAMPEMDGPHFLESLREKKAKTPVVLLADFASVALASQAVRSGESDYVTKPFTPEDILQAVHRLLCGRTTAAGRMPANDLPFRFFRDAWFQSSDVGAARVGAMLVRPGVSAVESVRLPRVGDVVYQGLPLAEVTVAGQSRHWIPSPLSGVVAAVNDRLGEDGAALLSDPCGEGWIACICPTRRDEESAKCRERRVILLSRDEQSAREKAAKLQWLGCQTRMVADPRELAAASEDFATHVLLFDGATFDADGPNMVGAINTENSPLKVVVMASADCDQESAYRLRRIFYYSVEPFVDNEIADILAGIFPTPGAPQLVPHKDASQPLGGIVATNGNHRRVRLLAAPGLLRREEGLGLALRHRLTQERFSVECSPNETPLTPIHLLTAARRCDRLMVLMAQERGRLPGCLTRDTKAEYIALVGDGADKVTTLLVEPINAETPLAFEPSVTESLAEHLAREMANC